MFLFSSFSLNGQCSFADVMLKHTGNEDDENVNNNQWVRIKIYGTQYV